jgi:hypothetical protein
MGPEWLATSPWSQVGRFGAFYGMIQRAADQLFGEVFDLPGYRERDFWETALNVFNPMEMARDYSLAVILQGLGNCLAFGKAGPPPPEAAMRFPPERAEAGVAEGAGSGGRIDPNNLPKGWTKTENNGFTHIRDENGTIRMEIHPPDKVTTYPHQHIYDPAGNPLDINGNIVDYKSPDAHIPLP